MLTLVILASRCGSSRTCAWTTTRGWRRRWRRKRRSHRCSASTPRCTATCCTRRTAWRVRACALGVAALESESQPYSGYNPRRCIHRRAKLCMELQSHGPKAAKATTKSSTLTLISPKSMRATYLHLIGIWQRVMWTLS